MTHFVQILQDVQSKYPDIISLCASKIITSMLDNGNSVEPVLVNFIQLCQWEIEEESRSMGRLLMWVAVYLFCLLIHIIYLVQFSYAHACFAFSLQKSNHQAVEWKNCYLCNLLVKPKPSDFFKGNGPFDASEDSTGDECRPSCTIICAGRWILLQVFAPWRWEAFSFLLLVLFSLFDYVLSILTGVLLQLNSVALSLFPPKKSDL